MSITSSRVHVLRGHEQAVTTAAFSPDGSCIGTASGDSSTILWNASTGRQHHVLQGHLSTVVSISFSQDSRRLATAGADKKVIIWDVTTGRKMRILGDRPEWLRTASMAPDGRSVATASDDPCVIVWGCEDGERLRVLKHPRSDGVTSAVFSSDGHFIVSTDANGDALLWGVEPGRGGVSGDRLNVLSMRLGVLTSAAFSADDSRIVTASIRGTAVVWDRSTGQRLHVLRGHSGALISVAFSRDGRRVLTASDDKTAILWDTATGEKCSVLNGHSGKVVAVFSPDGRFVLTASKKELGTIWDVTTGTKVHALRGAQGQLAAFSPDGTSILTVTGDASAEVWSLSGVPPAGAAPIRSTAQAPNGSTGHGTVSRQEPPPGPATTPTTAVTATDTAVPTSTITVARAVAPGALGTFGVAVSAALNAGLRAATTQHASVDTAVIPGAVLIGTGEALDASIGSDKSALDAATSAISGIDPRCQQFLAALQSASTPFTSLARTLASGPDAGAALDAALRLSTEAREDKETAERLLKERDTAEDECYRLRRRPPTERLAAESALELINEQAAELEGRAQERTKSAAALNLPPSFLGSALPCGEDTMVADAAALSDLIPDQGTPLRRGRATPYRVHVASLGREVVVKRCDPDAAGSLPPSFHAEERALRRLRASKASNVIGFIGGYVRASDGVGFIVLELAPGGSLDAPRPDASAAPAPRALATQLAEGLFALHRLDLLHGDMKPSNVLLGPGRRALLSDFDCAKAVPTGDLAATTMRVTPLFAPPEWAHAAAGVRKRRVADVFGYGLIVALASIRGDASSPLGQWCAAVRGGRAGTPAFPGLVDDESVGADSLVAGCGELAQVLTACLRRDEVERPQSGEELAAWLDLLQHSPQAGADQNPSAGVSVAATLHRNHSSNAVGHLTLQRADPGRASAGKTILSVAAQLRSVPALAGLVAKFSGEAGLDVGGVLGDALAEAGREAAVAVLHPCTDGAGCVRIRGLGAAATGGATTAELCEAFGALLLRLLCLGAAMDRHDTLPAALPRPLLAAVLALSDDAAMAAANAVWLRDVAAVDPQRARSIDAVLQAPADACVYGPQGTLVTPLTVREWADTEARAALGGKAAVEASLAVRRGFSAGAADGQPVAATLRQVLTADAAQAMLWGGVVDSAALARRLTFSPGAPAHVVSALRAAVTGLGPRLGLRFVRWATATFACDAVVAVSVSLPSPEHLPVAHTCFARIDVGPYRTEDEADRALRRALMEGGTAMHIA